MDSSFDVPDPSDWLHTPISQLGPVETALRCQVCKDFFNTPMITSCSHTFCSLCIRRCLTNDGRCPGCRALDQEIKLRPNPIIQELVDQFQVARPKILHLIDELKVLKETKFPDRRKRKLEISDSEEEQNAQKKTKRQGRETRSQYRRQSSSQEQIINSVVENERDEDFEPDDGLTACPICGARMKEEAVFSHLDIHNGQDQASKPNIQQARSPHFHRASSNSFQQPKLMERLPQLNYGLLKDNALRKKLSELGIPNGGSRPLLIRRHTEWVNLVNANCDSPKPRSKRELLQELDIWDKTQGRHISNSAGSGSNTSSVMNKDFDGAAWAVSHDQDFQTLIARARKKPKPPAEDNKMSEESTEGSPSVEAVPGPARRQESNRNPQGDVNIANDGKLGLSQVTTVDLDAGD